MEEVYWVSSARWLDAQRQKAVAERALEILAKRSEEWGVIVEVAQAQAEEEIESDRAFSRL